MRSLSQPEWKGRGFYSWGFNFYGRLGLNDNNNRNTPQRIEYLNDKKIIQINGLGAASLALSRIYYFILTL